ncbi:Ligase-associated DNA damage response exonuclease [Planctomycetales bacterium 10988]|nr:Ligase-associated DNA damage response exonuclease [Planctomycetales bacterium 10988]
MSSLLQLTPRGLYCQRGDFYIDPKRNVPRAIITHAHADHARRGCGAYLTSEDGQALVRFRLKTQSPVDSLPYGETLNFEGVEVSFHPSGHMLGAVQVRLKYQGETWVVTSDCKLQADPTCRPFEAVPCDVLITECTFGDPVYDWPEPAEVFQAINTWWRTNQKSGKTSVLYGYSAGKTQRILASLAPGQGPFVVHRTIQQTNRVYRESGVKLPQTWSIGQMPPRFKWSKALVCVPPKVKDLSWRKGLGPLSIAVASGWMQNQASSPYPEVEQGFVLSDHFDWKDFKAMIAACSPKRILLTHGDTKQAIQHLNAEGIEAECLEEAFQRKA